MTATPDNDGWIEIGRKPEPGDTVKFKVLHGLMMCDGIGVVCTQTPYGATVVARCSQFWPIDTKLDVPTDWMTVVVEKSEVITYLREQLKLISVQEQGLGGSATPEMCWQAAKRIALAALASVPEPKP
jgi:hypothetical protein